MFGRKHVALGGMLLRRNFLQGLLRRAKVSRKGIEHSTRLLRAEFERRNFRVQRPQFTLHAERTRFVRAPAGNHTALVASSVRRNESKLRIVARQFLSSRAAVGQVSGLQPR